jgi:hypothetical protein
VKPLGMTAAFQVTRPTPAEDAVWEAVQRAIDAGMTPRQFRLEAAEAWEHLLREAGKAAADELSKDRK